MKACNVRGPLIAYVGKLFPKSDCSAFDALARIMSGSVKPGDTVRVLGESFTPDDEEDSAVATVTAVWAYQARYRVPLPRGSAGSWVLLEGLDATISKTATVVSEFLDDGEEPYIFHPLRFDARPVVKIATEPLNPGELPKMVEGLRRLNRSYPALSTKVEESGEHTIFGTGELYLDSAMKDLRELYADVEVKVADPVISFCETVVETSSLKCFSETPNKRNKLTVIAEPLDTGLGEDIERGAVSLEWPRKRVAGFFQDKYDWDLLAARKSSLKMLCRSALLIMLCYGWALISLSVWYKSHCRYLLYVYYFFTCRVCMGIWPRSQRSQCISGRYPFIRSGQGLIGGSA